MNKTFHFLKYWLPVILWATGIFYLSSVPDLKSALPGNWDLILRKGAHILEYAVLSFLCLRTMNKNHDHSFAFRRADLAFIVCFLYALSDEYHQSFVLGRHASLFDVGVDSLGIALGLSFCYLLKTDCQKRTNI